MRNVRRIEEDQVPRYAVVAIVVAGLSACSAPLPSRPTAQQIKARALSYTVGWDRMAETIATREELRAYVLSQICTGDAEWLVIAQHIYPSRRAHFSEELGSAISVALLSQPDKVLGAFGARACIEPDELPAECDAANWRTRARSAVAQVSAFELEQTKTTCTSQLGTKP